MAIVACPRCGAKNRVDERAATLQPVCGRCGAALPSSPSSAEGSSPLVITDATFNPVVMSSDGRPVLVDCWAPWCGPCRMLAPALDELAAESSGRYVVAKLNVDENPQTAQQFQVSSIPTLLLFKEGRLVDRIVGLQPKQALAARVQKWV